jgi:hypothetical protein
MEDAFDAGEGFGELRTEEAVGVADYADFHGNRLHEGPLSRSDWTSPIEICGLPPIRQEKGEWMGHGGVCTAREAESKRGHS